MGFKRFLKPFLKYLFVVALFLVLMLAGINFGFLQKDFQPAVVFLSEYFDFSKLKLAEASIHFFFLFPSDNCREITYSYGVFPEKMPSCYGIFNSWRKWGFDIDSDSHPLWLVWNYWQENTERRRPITFGEWETGALQMGSSWAPFMEKYEGSVDDIHNPCHEITLYYTSDPNYTGSFYNKGWGSYGDYYKRCEEKFNETSGFEYDDPDHPLWLFWQMWDSDEKADNQRSQLPPLFDQWETGAGLLAQSGWDFARQPFFSSLPGFGGNLSIVHDCTCYFKDKLFYMTPVPGSWSGPYLVTPSSDLHPIYGNISPGRWVLGDVNSGGVCMMRSNTGCYPIPTMFKVQPRPAGIGTSQ